MTGNKLILILMICRFIFCISSIGSALYLAFNGKDGWGWFLFAGILFGMMILKESND